MLAYGRSKRTLRFSSHTSHLSLGLAAPEESLSTPPSPPPGELNRRNTPDLLRSPPPSQRPTAAAHSPSSLSYPRFSNRVETGRRGREENRGGGDGMNSSGATGMYGHQQGSDGNATSARKRFRLDMDLGSDSDSSCERDDGGVTQHRSSAGRGEFSHNYRQIAHGSDGSHTAFGSSGSGLRQQQRGSVGRGGLGPWVKERHATPTHSTGQEQWQARGGKGDRTSWNPPGSVGCTSRGGRGRAGQYLDDGNRRESPSFVTPDHDAESMMEPPRVPPQKADTRPPPVLNNPYQAAVVTPDTLGRQQERGGGSSPAVKFGGGHSGKAATAGRDTARGGGGEGGWDRRGEGRASDFRQMPSLIAVQDVYPPELSRIWSFQKFNAIQSALYRTVAKSDRNVVVSAPTGCGKTAVLEMAIARLLHESGMHLGNRKIIYVSPIKALCQQTLDDWTAKFAPLGIRLAELTSDSASGASKGSVSLRDLASADVILTTPEKWDSVTRRWKEHAFLVGTVALVLVDEVHTIGEERGATLEVILTRMKMVSRSAEVVSMGLPASRMRFIALSATLPNANDFGSFLGADVFRFGDEYRPVSLQTHVVGYASGNNPFLFDRGLNKHVPGIVSRYSNGKPALVFCGSKKDTETLAGSLTQNTDYARRTGSQVVLQYLATAASKAEDPQLAKFIVRGVAIHNSGLSPQDRGLVERAFLSGSLAVLVATTTLAMGVNLPARLVVIKGTNQYRGAKGYEELPKSAILQMMGRAGRPGFDSSGVAVVMTSQSNKKDLERLSAGQEAVESSLQARLLEALNSEVCQGETIHDIGEAIEWLRSTFYFIRCQKNPAFYGLPAGLTDGGLYGHMQNTCLDGLKQLRDAGVIAMDQDEFSVQPTPHGVLFSRFMVRFESMKALMSVSESHGTRDILRVCADCHELSVPVRRAEKRILNDLNKNVRYPPPKKEIVRTPADKALVLLQASLGGLPLEDWTLRGEQTTMLEAAARLLGCCAESLAVAGRGGGLGCAVSLRLMRSVRLKMWMDTELGQLRQLPGVGETLCIRLGGSHIITLVDLARAPAGKVDTIAGRKHPFGHGIRHAALQLLSRALTASVSRHQLDNGREELQVRVDLAFQSTDSFANGYIEAPDDAYAPPPTGWRRHDTNFQLLVYYDAPRSGQEGGKGEHGVSGGAIAAEVKPSPTSAGVSEMEPQSAQGSSKSEASPLLLFRKVSGESTHTALLPAEAVESDLTVHLWLICAGVCGMDVVDVRMKPSSLDSRSTSVEELRGIWKNNGRTLPSGSDGESEGRGDPTSASDRAGWSQWEQGSPTPRSQRPSATSRRSACGGGSGAGGKGKKGGGGSRGARRGPGKGKGKGGGGVGVGVGVGVGAAGSDGGRQLDLASSFKAGAQRALSESARKRSSVAAGGGDRGGGGATEVGAAHAGRSSQGMTRGDLGGIGISEAGDDLGVSPGSAGVSTKRKAGDDAVGDPATPLHQRQQAQLRRQQQQQQQQARSAGRTWSSKGRESGSIVSGGKDVDIGTYNPGGRAMRTVLRQKGSEMNLSSRVGVDRLGRHGGNNNGNANGSGNGNGGINASHASPGEKKPNRAAGEWSAIGVSSSGGSSSGGASNGSRYRSVRRVGDTSNTPLGFGKEDHGGGGGGGAGGAVVDLFPRSLGSALAAPPEARSPQHYQPSQRRLPPPPPPPPPPQQQRQQPADFSSFAYKPPPPPPSEEVTASPAPGHAGTNPGAGNLWQRHPHSGYQAGGGTTSDSPAAETATCTAATLAGVIAASTSRPAARSWDEVSRQRGKGRHASIGVGRSAAAGEPHANEWALSGMMLQQGEDGSVDRFEAHGASGRGADARRRSSVAAPVDGYGDSASDRGGGRPGARGQEGTASRFFVGGESGSSERQVAGPGRDAFPSSAPAAAEEAPTPSALSVRRHVAPPPTTKPYPTTPWLRKGNGNGSGGSAGGRAGVNRNPRKAHESPVCIAPVAVTVSRVGRSGSGPGGVRSSTGGVVRPAVASATEAGDNGGRENDDEGSAGRSTRAVSRSAGCGGWSGREEECGDGVVSGPATPSAPLRVGERGGGLVDGGGTGGFGGEMSTGFGSGGEEGGGAEDVEDVAKKLDFHTVFD